MSVPVPLTRKETIQALKPFARSSTRTGVVLFLIDVAVYAGGFALAVLTESWALRLFGALLMGVKMTALYTLSHDASHNSLTASRPLSKFLAVVGLFPALMNQRLWVYDHVAKHHARTNGPQVDIYRPMSLAQYRAVPWRRRLWERFVRSSSLVGRAIYLVPGSRWLIEKAVPNGTRHPKTLHVESWWNAGLLLAWVASIVALLVQSPLGSEAAFPRQS